jgi:hypothetical protein
LQNTPKTSTPTRAALLTGRYAVNVGLPFPLLAHAVAGIDPSIPTMAEQLKTVGYRTHLVGKWHVGNAQRSMLPTKRGFDSFFGLVGGGFDHYTKEGGGQVDLWRCVVARLFVSLFNLLGNVCVCVRARVCVCALGMCRAHHQNQPSPVRPPPTPYPPPRKRIHNHTRNTRQLSEAEIDPSDHATNLFSREAIAVIQQHAAASPAKPLFLYVAGGGS